MEGKVGGWLTSKQEIRCVFLRREETSRCQLVGAPGGWHLGGRFRRDSGRETHQTLPYLLAAPGVGAGVRSVGGQQ